jgi:hypothetical protein
VALPRSDLSHPVGKGHSKTLGFCAFACRDSFGLDELRARAAAEGLEHAASPSPLFEDQRSLFVIRMATSSSSALRRSWQLKQRRGRAFTGRSNT